MQSMSTLYTFINSIIKYPYASNIRMRYSLNTKVRLRVFNVSYIQK